MKFIIYFSLIFPLNTFAALTCSQLFSDYTAHERKALLDLQVTSFDRLRKNEEQMAKNTISEINTQLGWAIKTPSKVILEIAIQADNAEFNWSDKITYPRQFFVEGKPKHPKYSQIILAHEYGHYIFSFNLRGTVENYAKFEDQAKMAIAYHEEVRRSSDAYENAVIQLAQAKKTQNSRLIGTFAQKVEVTEKLFDIASEKMDQLSNEVKNSEFTRISILSYHELFADVIAILYAKNPAAMSDTLRSASISNKSEQLTYHGRSFLNRIPLRGWSQSDPHILFAPTRRFIWDYILSNPKYNLDRGTLVKDLLFCIEQEIITRIRSREFDLTPEKMNQQLIDRLANQFP